VSDAVELTLHNWRTAIDRELTQAAFLLEDVPDRLRDALGYSLTGPGKRIRGLLLMASYDAAGGRGDASGLAAAVEVVHAYSLVHDDLPCMDDDDLRRGRATTHRAFDTATATVAGVAMVPLAVEQAIRGSRQLRLAPEATMRSVAILMHASGASGMVGGQLLDLMGEGRNLAVGDLEAVHTAKTGALIVATFTMGGIAAGAAAATLDALAAAGSALGLAFQIADDVLDATESSAALGKTAGRDAALSKSTYPSLLGVASARERSDALVADAMGRLTKAGVSTPTLQRLAHFIAARRS